MRMKESVKIMSGIIVSVCIAILFYSFIPIFGFVYLVLFTLFLGLVMLQELK